MIRQRVDDLAGLADLGRRVDRDAEWSERTAHRVQRQAERTTELGRVDGGARDVDRVGGGLRREDEPAEVAIWHRLGPAACHSGTDGQASDRDAEHAMGS